MISVVPLYQEATIFTPLDAAAFILFRRQAGAAFIGRRHLFITSDSKYMLIIYTKKYID